MNTSHFLSRLALGGLLLSAPLRSLAQSADPTPAPRFYGGLGAYSSFYQPLGSQAYRSQGVRLPVQLTAGYQWHPRLAVQVGLAYSASSGDYFNAGRYFTGDAGGAVTTTYFEFGGTQNQRNASLSVLARYTLTRKPAHRVQFDLLGGLTLEHGTSRDRGTYTDSTQRGLLSQPYDLRSTADLLLLTLGPSVRYRLGEHFELLYDLTFNATVLPNPAYGNRWSVTSASTLGLRYRFGRR